MRQYDIYGPSGIIGSTKANTPDEAALDWVRYYSGMHIGTKFAVGSILAPPFFLYRVITSRQGRSVKRIRKINEDITRGMLNK